MKDIEAHEDVQKDRMIHLTEAGKYISDVIYGGNDGIITTFAIVVASTAAGLSPAIILILGFANLFADGFSMASSNYLGTKSQEDFELRQKQIEEYEVEHFPEEELKELEEILIKKGFEGEDLKKAVEVISKNKQVWVNEMLVHELGILPHEEKQTSPLIHALMTFVAFVVLGSTSLIPFLFGGLSSYHLLLSVFFASFTLFIVGGLRSKLTQKNFLTSGLQMLIIGGFAAGIAYLIGLLIREITGIAL